MPAKQPTKKAYFGGVAKNLSTPRKAFIALVAVLVLAVGGYYGYQQYQVRKLKASASNYIKLGDRNGYTILACKYSTAYGYVVRVVGTKPANSGYVGNLEVDTFTDSSYYVNGPYKQTKFNSSWWGNVIAVQDAYAGDGWWFKAYIGQTFESKKVGISLYSTKWLPNC